jgi:hypothetical protein
MVCIRLFAARVKYEVPIELARKHAANVVQHAWLPCDARPILSERPWSDKNELTEVNSEVIGYGACKTSSAPTKTVLPTQCRNGIAAPSERCT